MGAHTHDETWTFKTSTAERPPGDERRSGRRAGWNAVRDMAGAAVGTVLGMAPHVLHHVGLLAGTALVTGASGNALFYVVGLLMSVPMLRRIYRRFRTPWAPAIAVVIFTGLFAISAFLIGPAISGDADIPAPSDPPSSPADPGPVPTDEHGH